MLCAFPYRNKGDEYGCGKCAPCLMNRRRLWAARLILESHHHQYCWFVTLTYNDESLPLGGTLVPRHVQLWLKAVRHLAHPNLIRFYAAGEYGDKTERPHYHAIIFGAPDPDIFSRAWPHGFTHTGLLTPASASYTVSYITKGMSNATDPRLNGRYPEFARMSLRPGIGAAVAPFIAEILHTKAGVEAILKTGDIPPDLRWDNQKHPLGRYLKAKIREAAGLNPGEPTLARDSRRIAKQLGGHSQRIKTENQRSVDKASAEARIKISNSKKVLT